MAKSSAAQRKAAPRKATVQQPEQQASTKNGRGQATKGQGYKPSAAKAQAGKATASMAKSRSSLLMLGLVVAAIGAVVNALLPLLYHKATLTPATPLVWGSAAVIGLLGLAGVYGLWQWKRWGLYTFVAAVVVSIGTGLSIFPLSAVALQALIALAVLLVVLMREKALPRFA